MRPRWQMVVACALSLRFLEWLWISPNVFRDSSDYLNGWSLAGKRPPLTGMVYAAFGGHQTPIALFQTLLMVEAWLLLIVEVDRRLRHPAIRVVTGASLILTSLAWPLLIWDSAMLTEALCLSLTCLLVAAALRATEDPSRLRIGLLLVVAVLFAAVRDTDAQLLLVVAPFALGIGFFRRDRRPWLVVGGSFAAIWALAFVSQAAGHRAEAALKDEVLVRVLPDRAHTDYFIAHGMPYSPSLAALSGRTDPDAEVEVLTTPQFAAFRRWADAHGEWTILSWALRHPVHSAVEPFREQSAVSFDFRVNYPPPREHDLIDGLGHVVHPNRWWVVDVELGLAALGGIFAFRQRRRLSTLFMAGAVLIVLAIVELVIVWNTEAIEVPRHGLGADLLLRIGLIMCIAAAVDSALPDEINAGGLHLDESNLDGLRGDAGGQVQ